MRIVELREMSVPLRGNISNALVNFSEHTVSLVAVITDVVQGGRPVAGIAFDSIGRYAQGGLLRERFFPRLERAAPEALLAPDGEGLDPGKVRDVLLANEKPGGHGDRSAAVGGLELAVWDLNAKLRDEPAYRTIARHAGRAPTSGSVPVYAAGGYYDPDKGVAGLKDELRGYRDLGFSDFKIKIGGAALPEDLARIEAALQVAEDGAHLAVDANGRFDLDTALDYAEAIAPFRLRWYEEIGDPLDYDLNRRVTEAYDGAVATGENLFSVRDVANLLRHGGMRPGRDVFQMDPGLSYGLLEYLQMLALLEAHGFDRRQAMPHGGHLINLHIVAALGLGGCEAYPAVFQPFGGYSPGCLRHGGVAPTDAPGFGLEEKPELAPLIAELLA